MMLVLKNRGFTLIELLIVLIIMGIVYSFIGNSIFSKNKSTTLTLKNLPEVARQIAKEREYKPLTFLIYGTRCDKYIWLSNNEPLNVEFKIDINGNHIKPYRFNYYGELDSYQFLDFYIDNRKERVCLEFHLFKNYSNSSYILEDDEKDTFYLFRPYYQPVEIYKSLDEAK